MQLRRLARPVFWAATLFAFIMAVLPHPPRLPGQPDDKIQHVLAFATLGLLAAWAYRRTVWWQLVVGLSAFGALIEVVQAVPQLHRDSDVVDWVADTVACGLILAAVALWRMRARR